MVGRRRSNNVPLAGDLTGKTSYWTRDLIVSIGGLISDDHHTLVDFAEYYYSRKAPEFISLHEWSKI
jgi:hypothetical protein